MSIALRLMSKYSDCTVPSEELARQALLMVIRHQVLESDTLYAELRRVLGYDWLPDQFYQAVQQHLKAASRNIASIMEADRKVA